MELKDHIWTLTAKKLAGEATADELKELSDLLKDNPAMANAVSSLEYWWQSSKEAEHDNSHALFSNIRDKINSNRQISDRIYIQALVKYPQINAGMIKNYFKIAYRQLGKQKMYAAIKIGGFAFSIAACILIALFIRNETSFDQSYPDADRIYRVVAQFNDNGVIQKGVSVPAPFGKVLTANFPEITESARLMPNRLFNGAGSNEIRTPENVQNTHEEGFTYADQGILDLLQLPMVYGDRKHALDEPYTIVITKKKADKYFPNQNPVGKIMFLNNDETRPYKIGGVIADFPATSHLQYDFLLTLSSKELWPGEQTTWGANNYVNYLKVRPGTDIKALEKKMVAGILTKYVLPAMTAAGNKSAGDLLSKASLYLQPISDVNLKSYDVHDSQSHGDIRFVWLFAGVAGFILIIACINFVNLSTAKSANRAKEVGLRKVVGSTRSSLVQQFLAESLLYSFLSFVIAVALAWALLPYFNVLAQKNLTIPFSAWWLLPSLFAAAIVIGVIAGLYPAFYLSGFKPINVLKGKLSTGTKGSFLRNSLVVFQFATSIILIIGTVVIYNQMQFILNKKLGYDKSQVVMLQGANTLGDKVKSLKTELLKLSAVKSVSISDFLPVTGTKRNGNVFYKEGKTREDVGLGAQFWNIDHDYIKTMGMKLAEGRNFSPRIATDSQAVIINQAMVKKLSLSNPVGKRITDGGSLYTVIGVVEDFNFESLRNNVDGVVLHLDNSPSIISVKLNTGDMRNSLAAIKALWAQFSPAQPIRYSFLDERFTAMYADVQRMGSIFTSFAVLAIIIACLGLFGLSAFMAEQRSKEIGIRKVLGASISSITSLLSMDFIKLVALAILIASPIAWWGMNTWLQDFANRTPIQWWVFALSALLAIFIAVVTVSFQSIKAALMNPVKSLKSE